MKKIQENKKTIIIASIIIVLLVVLILALQSCSEDEGTDSKQPGTEMIIEDEEQEDNSDNGEFEGGLSVSSPENADENDSEEAVEFINPDEVGNSSQTPSKDNSAENDKSANDNVDSEKDENTDGGLDENVTESDSGKYGEFF